MSKEKSPAFQFYAAEYLADENVQLMSMEDEGCYVRLMCYCWREGSIPADPVSLARLCKGVTPSALVLSCFKGGVQNDRLVHQRLEFERDKQAVWRAKSAEGGKRSAHKRKHPRNINTQQGGSTTVPRVVQPKGNSSSSVFSLQSSSSDIAPLVPPMGGKPKSDKRCPENFEITPDMRAWAREKYPEIDVDSETEAFRDHEYARARTDWPATWRNWIRGARKFGNGNGAKAKSTQKTDWESIPDCEVTHEPEGLAAKTGSGK